MRDTFSNWQEWLTVFTYLGDIDALHHVVRICHTKEMKEDFKVLCLTYFFQFNLSIIFLASFKQNFASFSIFFKLCLIYFYAKCFLAQGLLRFTN